MALSPEAQAVLDRIKIREEAEAPKKFSAAIAAKREELELKKLEMEIEKLAAPATQVDYVKQMLDLQQSNFNNLIKMQQENNAIQLKLAQIEAGGSGEDWLSDILPLLPELLKMKGQGAAPPQAAAQPPAPVERGQFTMKIPTAEELEAYKKAIKSGEVTEQMFYDDSVKQYPDLVKKVTREQITAEYNKLKNGG